jgi:hypothetical protein
VSTAVAALLVALVGILGVSLVAWPLLGHADDRAPGNAADDERQVLDDEIERSLAALREIEFDRRAGNLSETDFAALNAQERARAADLLRRRDELSATD